MTFPAFEYIAPRDYLEIEARADRKHEYFDGRMYAMAGAGLDHNYITADLMRCIGNFLEGKDCDVLGADLRITTPEFNSYMYPDLSIICNGPVVQENSFDTVINPSVIIEVLSPSTRGYDMAFKFYFYKQIPSLKEYVVVDSTKHYVQVHRRRDDGLWEEAITIEDLNSVLHISTIDMQLPLKDIYRKVSF